MTNRGGTYVISGSMIYNWCEMEILYSWTIQLEFFCADIVIKFTQT